MSNPPDEKQANAALLRNQAEAALARHPLAAAAAIQLGRQIGGFDYPAALATLRELMRPHEE